MRQATLLGSTRASAATLSPAVLGRPATPLGPAVCARGAPFVRDRVRSRSRVVAFDIVQSVRDATTLAADVVASRTITFIIANILATLAWQGIASFLDDAKPKNVKTAREVRWELSTVAAERAREIPLQQWLKLIPCILLDLGGDASYILPFVGEIGDTTWAPTSAFLVRSLFNSNAIAGIDFVKEALPFTDFIPVATIAWALETFAPESAAAKALGIKSADEKAKKL
ncbi:hypothetical protein T492DRAFT_612790 [Pavlovales sp. CCMP2436]|nr:hypothetical protein T492DRAFT_612790 [Pavlovales sp. CCMP2436]